MTAANVKALADQVDRMVLAVRALSLTVDVIRAVYEAGYEHGRTGAPLVPGDARPVLRVVGAPERGRPVPPGRAVTLTPQDGRAGRLSRPRKLLPGPVPRERNDR